VEGATLCEVVPLLTNEAYRRKIVGKLDDPIGLESFWGWYEGLSDAEKQATIGPVLNKLRSVITRPTVRGIIGQSRPAVQMADVLAEGKILICSLPSGLLGDDAAALLGSLIMAELWNATKGRARLPESQRTPFFAHIDEFQNFVRTTTPMDSVLAEARGFGLGMTLAHQHLAQLNTETKHAVLATARSRVVFQLAAVDAHPIAKEMGPLISDEDLQGLGQYEVVAQFYAGGMTQAPATGRTRALPAPISDPDVIRARSREHFGVARAEVERAIRARQSGPTNGPIGRRARPRGAS
ncbi:MAG: type IV secretory system conjugative DNA transfer family protein, partial [Rhizomicrobium sp.]